LFGRDAEWRQLEQLLDGSAVWPAGVALEGAPGIGKSTLWREAVGLARERGLQVIATAPSEPDRGLAFAALGDLFDGLPETVLAGLPEPQRRAVLAALFVANADPSADSQALPRAVLGVLRGLAAGGPLLVAIDDEQWLDRASARVLAFVLCRVREERIGVLLSRRADSDGGLWPALERGFGGAGVRALVLEPLSISAVQRLIAARLQHPISRSLLHRIHEASGGNPLYALAIAGELETRASDPVAGELPIPRSLTDAVAKRLQRLDPRDADPLLVIAAASRPTIALLQSVLPDFVLSDLDGAERAGVVEVAGEGVAFTHPLLAATHYSNAPPARRRELHRLLAEVLEDEEQRAYHSARGAEAPHHEIAVRIELAAQAAVLRGAPEAGAELLEQASRLTPADAVEAGRSRIIAAAELRQAGGDATRARELLEALLPQLPHGPTRARALHALATVRTDDNRASEALLGEALAEAGDHDRLRAQIQAELAGLLSVRAKFAPMIPLATAAVEAAERANDAGLLAVALATYAFAHFICGHGIELEALRRGIELEGSVPASVTGLPSGMLARSLYWSDDYEAARPAMEQVVLRARERGEVYTTGSLLFELGLLEWYAGNRDAAERHQLESEALVREQGDHELDLWLMWGESLRAVGRGELDCARVAAVQAAAMAELTANPLIESGPATVLASVELWSGRSAAAHELLSPVRESFLSSGLGFMGSLSLALWSVDIEALVACGRLEEAQVVVDDLLHRARGSGNPNAIAIAERCRGLLLGARGEIAAGIEAMETALTVHARRPLAPETARTLLELGVLQRRAKQKTAAKQSLERALAMFEEMGARMWEERARDEIGRIGLRRAAVSAGLTPAQQRVAELVASGMSNREVASTLYMSVRSVESHLTKAYRELGVKSRSQLVAAMSAERAAAGNRPGGDV